MGGVEELGLNPGLKVLQKAVGGYIEEIYTPSEDFPLMYAKRRSPRLGKILDLHRMAQVMGVGGILNQFPTRLPNTPFPNIPRIDR